MSKLQLLARRCPIMGKALAIQSSKAGRVGIPAVAATAGLRAVTGHAGRSRRAKIHTTTGKGARPVEAYDSEKGGCVCLCVRGEALVL